MLSCCSFSVFCRRIVENDPSARHHHPRPELVGEAVDERHHQAPVINHRQAGRVRAPVAAQGVRPRQLRSGGTSLTNRQHGRRTAIRCAKDQLDTTPVSYPYSASKHEPSVRVAIARADGELLYWRPSGHRRPSDSSRFKVVLSQSHMELLLRADKKRHLCEPEGRLRRIISASPSQLVLMR